MSAALAEKNPSKTLGSKGLEPLAKEYDHKCHVVTKEIGASQVYSAALSIIAELKLIVDSGATVHCVRNREEFTTYTELKEGRHTVSDAGANSHPAIGIGNITRLVDTPVGRRKITIKNVLHIPTFHVDILSMKKMRKEGYMFVLPAYDAPAHMISPNQTQVTLPEFGGLDYLELLPSTTVTASEGVCVGGGAGGVAASVQQYTNNVEEYIAGETNLALLDRKQFDSWLKSADADTIQDELVKPMTGDRKYRNHAMRMRVAELNRYCPQADIYRDTYLQWHSKLGHANCRTIARTLRQLDITEWKKLGPVGQRWCEHCARAKSTRAAGPYKDQPKPQVKPWQSMYADVAGRYKVASIHGGYHYEMHFICQSTNSIKTYGMQNLQSVPEIIDKHLSYVATNFPNEEAGDLTNRTVEYVEDGVYDIIKGTRIRTDSAQYYKSIKTHKVLTKYRVKHEFSAGYTQRRNGMVERSFRTIHDKANAMRSARRMGKEWWYLANRHAVTVHDITPTDANEGGVCPYEARTGKMPSEQLKTLHNFGAQAFVHEHVRHDKLDNKGREGIYVGWYPPAKTHLIWLPPRGHEQGKLHQISNTCEDIGCTCQGCSDPTHAHTQQDKSGQPPAKRQRSSLIDTIHVKIDPTLPQMVAQGHVPVVSPNVHPFTELDEDYPEDQPSVDRGELDPGLLDLDYWNGDPRASESWVSNEYDPSQDYQPDQANALRLSIPYPAVLAVGGVIPRWSKAKTTEHADMYRAAKEAEWNQMFDLDIMEPIRKCDVPKGETLFPSLMNFTLKNDSEGSITKAKARLCFGGHKMIKGIHYTNGHSLCPKWSTIRAFMAHAAKLRRTLRCSDIPGAFLLGPPQKVMFMRAPNDQVQYDTDGEPFVYKVKGNTYGTKTSNKIFSDCLAAWLKEEGFDRKENDPCVYIRAQGTPDEVQLCVWVDDLAYHAASPEALSTFERQLQQKWGKHKPMQFEDMKYFLGANVEQKDGKIHLHHKVMIERALEKFFPGGAATVHTKSTPFPPGATVDKRDCPKPGDQKPQVPYRELVGILSYLSTVSRPDIQYSVSQLASVQINPSIGHWQLAKHVLRYLAKTPTYGPTYSPEEPGGVPQINSDLTYYVDASYADVKCDDFGPTDDGRRNYYGYVGMYAGGPISWSAKMHKGRRALSSSESELVASCYCGKDIVSMRWQLEDFGVINPGPTPMYEDNQACIYILNTEGRSERTKHIEVKWFYCRDLVTEGIIVIKKIHTSEQTADVMTKSLPRATHEQHATTMVGQAYTLIEGKDPFIRLTTLMQGVPQESEAMTVQSYCRRMNLLP